ncbi:DUF302 domain-containing protein [Hydrogenimonas cancrithermarum]|uniref:DUF302 domain-containing protein n=1 Tax=Hydrogenimonas cancrithermarum TaxID=2993563 RepID=A0ABM8FJX5_9BACT|nr:DUF302 domain-containing protein [Hydrogenimonas cancrithermarum]BDY12607.1 hypothetical protein HCR_09190 [Hydrogenimonas cancrithermarum]
MKTVMKLLLALTIVTGAYADNKEIIMFGVKKTDKVTTKSIEEAFTLAGYKVEGNRDMNGPFTKQFGKTRFSIYNLMTVYHPDNTKALVSQYEESGVFAPFSIVIYQKKGDDTVYAGVLSAFAKAKIMGLPYDNKVLQDLEARNIETLLKAMPGAKRVKFDYTPKPLAKDPLTRFEIESDPEEAEDLKEEVEMVIEDGLKPIGFVMANFLDYNYFLKEAGIDTYIFYDTYSLCKLKVIYTVSQIRPEAGVFAPCTMAIYQKKDSDRMKMVYPNVYNWMATLAIEDPTSLKELEKAQADIVELLKKTAE